MKVKKSKLKESAKPAAKVINIVYKINHKELKQALGLLVRIEKILKRIKL